jgi:predicted nucleotidyltransferase component of viral defense system
MNPLETACRVDDLLREIEDLKIQRDHYAKEAEMERVKNRELEDEFHVLRGLIAENNKPIGYEENMALKHQFHHEREMRIHAENDVNKLRAQLADALAASHRDTLNLKKALSDMQVTN